MSNNNASSPRRDTTAPKVAPGQQSEPSTHSTPLQIIFRFIGERKGLFGLNLGLRMVKDLLPFVGPILIGITVDLLSGTDRRFFGIDLATNDLRSLYIVVGFMAALAVAKMVVGYVHTVVAAHMGRHVVEAARRDLAEASMQMALDERRRFNSGDLLDRSLADSKGLRSFTQNVVIRVISNTVRVIWPLAFMFWLDWVMALVVIAVIPLQSGISAVLQQRLQRLTRNARAAEASHTSAVKEAIDGWNSVASVGGQDWVTRELKQSASLSEDAKISKKKTTASIGAVISLCTALGIAACYAIGGWRIIDAGVVGVAGATSGEFTLGDLVAFVGVAKKTYAPFQAYTKIISNYRTGLVNLERIAEVLDAPMIDPRRSGPELVVTMGDVELDSVSFTYTGDPEPTLRSLTGRIPGRTLSVITGSSGTGKTTLLRLFMGLDQPTSGTISIDGQNINVVRLASLQSVTALVPQEPMLFSGSLGDNLLLGQNEVTTEDLIDACHRAGLLDLVRELPDGLDTHVGSGRHMLSGGQLRRMAIARALLRKPEILLLDEPTAGLDDANANRVIETLRQIAQRSTVIMVSHRTAPLAASDHHLVLDGGYWRDGSGSGDRWRPEPVEAVATPVAEAPTNPAVPPTFAANGHAANSHAPNGHAANGHVANGHAANDHAANGDTAESVSAEPGRNGTVGPVPQSTRTRLGLSAMGRTINLDAFDDRDAAARVLIVGDHRATAATAPGTTERAARAAIAQSSSGLAVAQIASANPDGAYNADGRTVLGIDVVADHRIRRATETPALHRAVHGFNANLIIDLGKHEQATRPTADVDVTIRYFETPTGSAPEWVAQLGAEIRRRLRTSRFSVEVSLARADSSSITSVTGVPVIEVTATPPPNMSDDERADEALVDVSAAACAGAVLALQLAPLP